MRLADLVTEDRVLTRLDAASKEEALAAVAALFDGVEGLRGEDVRGVLEERERLASTGVGSGVAIPHGRIPQLQQLLAAVAISPKGIPFDAIDGQAVHILVVVLAPQRHTGDHLKVLARVSRMLRSKEVRQRLVSAPNAAGALQLLREEDARDT